MREKQERDKNLEKKRKTSREIEKSQKKREFFEERFFQRKFSFPREKSLFTCFSLNILEKNYQKNENGSIGCVRAIRIVQKSRKSIRSGQKVKKRIFSGKNIF